MWNGLRGMARLFIVPLGENLIASHLSKHAECKYRSGGFCMDQESESLYGVFDISIYKVVNLYDLTSLMQYHTHHVKYVIFIDTLLTHRDRSMMLITEVNKFHSMQKLALIKMCMA